MRDYESVAKSLQCCASDSEPCEHCNCELEECNPKTIMGIAADAIEELLALACPHHHRNVHDRGDDSYCDALNREVPKEVE